MIEAKIREEAEKLALELVDKWKHGYDDSTNMRTLLYRYFEKAVLVGCVLGREEDFELSNCDLMNANIRIAELEGAMRRALKSTSWEHHLEEALQTQDDNQLTKGKK